MDVGATSHAYAFHHQPHKVSTVVPCESWVDVEALTLMSES